MLSRSSMQIVINIEVLIKFFKILNFVDKIKN